jgi:hypothetical protein
MPWIQPPTIALTKITSTTASSGDNTLVAAPGAGLQIVITTLILQNESASATTLIVKAGATAVLRVLCQNQGDGIALTYPPGQGLALGSNAALVLNLSGANSSGYSITYFIDAV